MLFADDCRMGCCKMRGKAQGDAAHFAAASFFGCRLLFAENVSDATLEHLTEMFLNKDP